MNNVNLIGRLTAEPELRYTPKGTAVANANIAVDDGFGDNRQTFFFGLTFWGKTAETAQKYATKGQRIGISGRLSQEEFTPKGSDKPVRKTHITVERLDLLDRPQGDRATGRADQPPKQQTRPDPEDLGKGDDIPF